MSLVEVLLDILSVGVQTTFMWEYVFYVRKPENHLSFGVTRKLEEIVTWVF